MKAFLGPTKPLQKYILPKKLFQLALLAGTIHLFGYSQLINRSQAQSFGPISPIPNRPSVTTDAVLLGSKLYFDARLSQDGTRSCASCHDFSKGGSDGKVFSTGVENRSGEVNAPTVLNSGLNYVQFWDGRATSLESQIDGPIGNVRELGTSWPEVVERLSADKELQELSQKAYGDNLTAPRIKSAIATFERTLTTPNSRFDKFLNGDLQAINEQERHGFQRFKQFGCTACHQGTNVGGNMFQKLGVAEDYFKDVAKTRPLTQADLGRFNVTHDPHDRHYFRVPSLRNVALTAPYFHDGSQKTLEQAIHTMGHYQLGRELQPEDVSAIAAFLRTLTGEMPKGLTHAK